MKIKYFDNTYHEINLALQYQHDEVVYETLQHNFPIIIAEFTIDVLPSIPL